MNGEKEKQGEEKNNNNEVDRRKPISPEDGEHKV